MNTAQKLRRLREEKMLSQESVAAALGLDRTTYVKYENGGSIKRNLQKLADFFGVSTDYLLGREHSIPHTGREYMVGEAPSPNNMLYPIATALDDVFTESEIEHLRKYRMLTSSQKAAIDCLTEHYLSIVLKENTQKAVSDR